MLRRSIERAFSAAEPRSLQTHVGLWIDKMLAAEEPSSQVAGPHLRRISEAPIPEGYELAYHSRRALFERAADRGQCVMLEAKTTSRLVVGLGAKGVLEMGITLDRTWGTPYLPGSALKGLCATTAHKLAEGASWRKPQGWPDAAPDEGAALSDYQLLFGTTENAGLVTFHDAWWVPAGNNLSIHMDVMTVHHADYYQGDPKRGAAPTDFDEPVPVPFLSVSGTFLIALEGPRDWCKAAGTLLTAGLAQLGAGAKTSSGYGHLALTPIVSEGERALRARLDELHAQLRGYRPGNKDAGVRASARAVQAGAGADDLAAALRQVDKNHRAALLDGVRAALDKAGRAVLDAAVAALVPAAAAARGENPPTAPQVVTAQDAHRTTRARYEADPKSPKRFFIQLEGEKKPLKGAVIDIDRPLVEDLRLKADWVDVVVSVVGGKTKIAKA